VLQYKGFGVNSPHEAGLCSVFQVTSPHNNAADTKLIWDVALLCTEPPSPLRIIVATKELAESAGHSLSFAQDWRTLEALL